MYRKYNNRKIIVDGITFDSKKEAGRYKELKILERAIPAQYEHTGEVYAIGNNKGKPKKGRLIERECAYYADFVYNQNGETIVEDTKGVRTTEYVIKRKLMLYVHDIRIKEV